MQLCEYDRVLMKLNFARTRQCKNKATVFVDGKHYCSLHTPEALKKREENRQSKSDQRFEKKKREHYLYLKMRNNA